MKRSFSAGKFAVEAWSDGHPMWLKITYEGEEIAHGIHHGEIKDLQFCLDRMVTVMRHDLRQNAHELG